MNAQVTFPELQRQIVHFSRQLHENGWAAGGQGNVTAMTADGRILATSADVSLGAIKEAELLTLDRFGRKLAGIGNPFVELPMHLAVFKGRLDVRAVVHAHPPASSAFAAANQAIEAFTFPEFIIQTGGSVPVVPFALPGSEALSQGLVPFMERYDVVLLEGHGVLAWGADLQTAMMLVELVEATARTLLDAATLGGVKKLPDPMISLLLEARTNAGLGPAGRARASAKR